MINFFQKLKPAVPATIDTVPSLLIILFSLNINVYSQCSGCNKINQKLDIWNIDYFCDHKIDDYHDCDEIFLKLDNIISTAGTDESIETLGFQKWKKGVLLDVFTGPNRYQGLGPRSALPFKG